MNRQAKTRKETAPYGRKETPTKDGQGDNLQAERARDMAGRLHTFNNDWSAIALRKKTVHNSPGHSTDMDG